MQKNRLFGPILVAAMLSGAALAQSAVLNPAHPDRYVVQRGDTLWDISERFLREPWLWPEIWDANQQIRNPHLIYPGDEVVLSFRDGKPVLRVRRGDRVSPTGLRTVKLTPRMRELPLDAQAIPTIPVDAISQFLSRPQVVSENELERAPYVLSLGKEHLVGGAGSKIYARGLGEDVAPQYAIIRPGDAYVHYETGEVLGYEGLYVGSALLQRPGDPATLFLTTTVREVLAGDRLIPVLEEEVDTHFFPRPPGEGVTGHIISVIDGVSQIGQFQVVVLDLGEEDGVEPGHVMGVYQSGVLAKDIWAPSKANRRGQTQAAIELDPEKQGGLDGFTKAADDLVTEVEDILTIEDPRSPFSLEGERRLHEERTGDMEEKDVIGQFAKDPVQAPFATVRAMSESMFSAPPLSVLDYHGLGQKPRPTNVRLPEERAGTVMVFRTFDRVSYALVMDATRSIKLNDSVKNP